jgi:hypothetical protein
MKPADFKSVGANLTKVAGKSPGAGYPNWASIANAGAKAAGSNDLAGVKGACKSCHDQYKKKFKDENRDMPFP